MPGVGAVFQLPFKSPGWFGTFALMGLIALIPILGWINLLGWELTTLDYYRQGRTDLPPAGLRYIGRGGNAFLALLVWYLPVLLVFLGAYVIFFIFIAAATAATGSSRTANAAGAGFGLGLLIYYLLLFVGIALALVVQVLQPAIIIASERGGVSAAASPSYVLSLARQNVGNTVIAALLFYAANFLGGLGIYACCIGIVFTLAYAYAVQAGVLRYYEYSLGDGAPPPAPPAAAPVTPA
ncbi:MAG: DUF4013 domain-containing protein [Candidatus Dormibacteraeota bacterium]|nr:DUF4013 domain-containing protein [Candidatus Dormibacteraeota bacterium]